MEYSEVSWVTEVAENGKPWVTFSFCAEGELRARWEYDRLRECNCKPNTKFRLVRRIATITHEVIETE